MDVLLRRRALNMIIILSLLDSRPRHGYDLSTLIETRLGGQPAQS